MTEVKGVQRTQLLDDFRNRRRYWELKEEAEDLKGKNDSSSFKHEEEIYDISHNSTDLLIGSIIIIIIIIIRIIPRSLIFALMKTF